MERENVLIPQADLDRQREFEEKLRGHVRRPGGSPRGLCGHLRLPAERGGRPEAHGAMLEADAASPSPRTRRRPIMVLLNTCAIREHAEDAGVRQPGRPDPHQEGEPGADHLPVRLHGPGAPGVGADQAVLSATWTWCSAPRPCGSSRSFCGRCMRRRGRVFSVAGRARHHCRGHPRGAGEGRKGLGLHHVRVQQLLLLLHRALCPGPGAQPGPRGRAGGGPAAGGGRGTRTSPCWART